MAYNNGISGINNVFGFNQTQLNPNYGTVQGQVPVQNPNVAPQSPNNPVRSRERNLSFMDFSQGMNQYNNLQYPQFNPYYRPNPAFQTGLAYGVNASTGTKVGTTFDLLTQSLFNLNNKLQPFFPQNNSNQNPSQAAAGTNNPTATAPKETVRRGGAQATYKQGGKYLMYQGGGTFDLFSPNTEYTAFNSNPIDPSLQQLNPNQFDLTPNPYWQQEQQPLPNQPQSDFVDLTMVDYTTPSSVREEQTRATPQDNRMGAANIVGASAAGLSFGLDLGKNIAAGLGVGRRSRYAWERAQERMRDATIQQGYEKDRMDLFNQGYLQTTNYMAQDGGQIPVSLDGLNQFPKQPVIVPSNNITMQGIPYDVMAYPNNDAPQLMKPDQQYSFPNSTQVLEKPVMKNGGLVKLEEGVYFDPTTQEFILQ